VQLAPRFRGNVQNVQVLAVAAAAVALLHQRTLACAGTSRFPRARLQ